MLISIPYLLLIGAGWAWFALSLAECIGIGFITRAIMKSKNREGGFAWGFFLAGVGIIVCASKRRIVYDPPTRTVSYYLDNQKVEKPAEPAKPDGWKCESCGRENLTASKFCPECGEHRHYKWACAKCNNINAADVRFCPECGNARSAEQEFTPGSLPLSEDFLSEAQQMETAAEIADAFTERCGSNPNENMLAMAQILEKINKYNNRYMNTKKMAIDALSVFFKNDMQVYTVDRSIPSITCPVCGKLQNNTREKCFSCGALFRE